MADVDTYKTIREASEGRCRDRGSKFLSYAWPVGDEREIKERLDTLRKRYFDATHHCYAWRLGARGEDYRANDDGEPSGSAGRPILGQLLSRELTYVLVAVVRYFGGTKLGIPNLISAYREAAADILDNSETVTLTGDAYYDIGFGCLAMNDVMKLIKEFSPRVLAQDFSGECAMSIAVRRSDEAALMGKMSAIEGVKADFKMYR